MSDLLEHGSPRPARPRWVPGLLVLLVVLAGGGYLAAQRDRPGPVAPSPSPSPADSTPDDGTQPPASAGAPWPLVEGGCDNEVYLPLLSVARLRERTGLRVLVGGAGLRSVDVDTGAVRRVRGVGHRQVTALARAGTHAYALGQSCEAQSPAGTPLRVAGGAATRAAVKGPVDAFLADAREVWGFSFGVDPDAAFVLRPLDGGPKTVLPPGFAPTGVTARRFVGAVYPTDGLAPGNSPEVTVLDRTAALRAVPLGAGLPLAAGPDLILTQSGCDGQGGGCVLERRRADGSGSRRISLPDGSTVSSEVVVSADGHWAAFQLARAEPDPRYRVNHPGGPSDVAMLDLTRGRVHLVPGLELAPKSSVGLAFSANGRWLVVALNEGSRTRLVVWRPGLDRPRVSAARLPGQAAYAVPVLVTGRAGR